MPQTDAIIQTAARRRGRTLWLIGIVFAAASCAGCERTDGGRLRSNAAANAVSPATTAERGGAYQLVMLGDSITAGYGLSPEKALPARLQDAFNKRGAAIEVVNAGVSGNTTADALARFDWSVGPDADAVLIELGGNDLLQGVDPTTTKANLKAIVDRANSRSLLVVVVGMAAPGNYGVEYKQRFDALYPDLAHEEGVALYPFLLRDVALTPALNQNDGIHPNAKGVERIAGELAPFLQRLIDQSRRRGPAAGAQPGR